MIKKRIIFALLYQDGYFHLSRNFKLRKVGDLNWLINNFGFGTTSNYIDELICLLVKRQPSEKDKKSFFNDVNELRKKIFIPITLGGGIRSTNDVASYFNNGADKILLNTSIFENELTNKISDIYGEQSISIMVDYQKNDDKDVQVLINGGTIFLTGLSDYLKKLSNLKFGEIIFNSIENDGTGNGLDLKLIKNIPDYLKLKPILLMGGAGKSDHILEGLKNRHISGVVTANLFNFLGKGLEDARKKAIKYGINLANFSADTTIDNL